MFRHDAAIFAKQSLVQAGLASAPILLGACGSDAPEDKLARAADEFDEARENVLESRQEITALEQAVAIR